MHCKYLRPRALRQIIQLKDITETRKQWKSLKEPHKCMRCIYRKPILRTKLNAMNKKLLEIINKTEKPYHFNKTIIQLFEDSVQTYPENTAIYLDKTAITYKVFNEKVNQFARHLKTIGIGSNDIVGIEISRSYEMMLAIFSVLKAGAAYLPLDPHFPVLRKKMIITNSKMKLLLCNRTICYQVACKTLSIYTDVSHQSTQNLE